MAEPNSAAPVSEVDFSDVQKLKCPLCQGQRGHFNPNKTNQNQTEFIQINLFIPSHRPPGTEGIDRYEQRKANTKFLRRVICAPLLCWTSPGRTNLSENQPPGQGPKPAPLAAQSQQVCRLLNRRPLLGGTPPNTPSKMCLTMELLTKYLKCRDKGDFRQEKKMPFGITLSV